jgi:predicted nucleic-acid-binding protein
MALGQLTQVQVVQLILAVAVVVGVMVLLVSKTLEAEVEQEVIDVLCQEKALAVVHQPNLHLLL